MTGQFKQNVSSSAMLVNHLKDYLWHRNYQDFLKTYQLY